MPPGSALFRPLVAQATAQDSSPLSVRYGTDTRNGQSTSARDHASAGRSTVHSWSQSTQRHKVRMMAGRGRVAFRGNVQVEVPHFGQAVRVSIR
jgi:hypothetical protein